MIFLLVAFFNAYIGEVKTNTEKVYLQMEPKRLRFSPKQTGV